jgi:CheY-like chemotaxis protein
MKLFFTSAEVGRICGMSVPTVLRLYREGALKGYRLHGDKGALRVPRDCLVEFMNERGIPLKILDQVDGNKKHLFVVGHDESLLKELKANFAVDARVECAIRVARDADDIMSACRNIRPDLIILDLDIAGTTGGDVLRLIRTSGELATVKIAVFSNSPRLKARVLKAGADDFVVKPDVNELRKTVYHLLGIERRH